MKVKAEETGEVIPAECKINIVEEDDRVLVNGFFEESTIAQVLLVNGEEVKRYTINTVPQHFQAMCVGTFQKADAREIDTFINKSGLSGNYEIKLLVQTGEDEFKIFDTGVTMAC